MSKKELARLRKHALHTNATDTTVEAFEAGHKDFAAKTRRTRKKAEAQAKAEHGGKKTKRAKKPVEPVVETPVIETPVVDAPIAEPDGAPLGTQYTMPSDPEPMPVVKVPFARSTVAAVVALPALSDDARAAIAAVNAKVFSKAVFVALPEPVRAELLALVAA
jgi:hypothetical protein